MLYVFDLEEIQGKKYKKLIQYLCEVSDYVYFTTYEKFVIYDGIPELAGLGTRASVPKELTEWCQGDVIGYETDIHVKQYFFMFDTLNQVLHDRLDEENENVFFYQGEMQIARIHNTFHKTLYIFTEDEQLMKEIK